MCGGPSARMSNYLSVRRWSFILAKCKIDVASGLSVTTAAVLIDPKILETSAEYNPMLISLVRLLNLDHAFRGGALDFFDPGNNAAGKSVKRFSLDCIFSA
jgi:hypothetical protein